MKSRRFFLVASHPDSLLNFRGALIDSLCAKNYEVHVAAPGLKEKIKISSELKKKGAHVHNVFMSRTNFNVFQDVRTCISLFLLMIIVRPSFVLSYTCKPVIYTTLMAYIARVPFRAAMITGLGYAFQEDGFKQFSRILVRLLYRFSLRKASIVFFHNSDDKQLFQTQRIIQASKPSIVVNGSGVDTKYYQLAPRVLSPIKFLLIARFLKSKGIKEYIEAAREIKSKYPSVQFLLVGWIDEGPDAIKQTELDQWVSEGVIHYLGYMNDVREIIAQSSVYVLPSYREGTPRSVLEAMAMGRAIITTDTPGCRETVKPNENGFLVKVKCSDTLVHAMEQFILNPILIEKMGLVSREYVMEKYEVNQVNNRMLDAMNI